MLSNAHAAAQLTGFRMVQQSNVMLHFDLSEHVSDANVFTLTNPDRLVMDLPKTELGKAVSNESFEQGVVDSIRYGLHGDNYLRIVVDLRRKVEPSIRMVKRKRGQRVIVDLGVKGDPNFIDYKARIIEQAPLRDVIVAIDAGHGGKDPGAVGPNKTLEKDVTLRVAKHLFKLLDEQPGITPVLIRDEDKYIALGERIRIAKRKNADLFISLHANASNRRAAHGSSVYALSLKGASSAAAKLLADKENEVDVLFGSSGPSGFSDDVRETLLDLTQNSTLEASLDMGAEVLTELSSVGTVHANQVEQANFAVLKLPNIPSLLIETAFISNPDDEKKLATNKFQQRLARAIQQGIADYLKRHAPKGTTIEAEQRSSG